MPSGTWRFVITSMKGRLWLEAPMPFTQGLPTPVSFTGSEGGLSCGAAGWVPKSRISGQHRGAACAPSGAH